jgi:hypothetical protein
MNGLNGLYDYGDIAEFAKLMFIWQCIPPQGDNCVITSAVKQIWLLGTSN